MEEEKKEIEKNEEAWCDGLDGIIALIAVACIFGGGNFSDYYMHRKLEESEEEE